MQLLDSKVLNAIRQSQYKQLALFIRHNYNLNVTTKDGRNGLFFALDIIEPRKRRRMIRFCLDHSIDALQKEKKNNYTPLHEAIARQQIDSVQLLLANAGGEIDWRSWDAHGRTILHQAVETNNVPIVEALIIVMNHYGVSVDIPDKHGLTPYLLATKLHLRDMALILANKGHASRQQRDPSTYRSADEWEIAGIEEHRLFIRNKLRQEIDTAKTEGKITKLVSDQFSPSYRLSTTNNTTTPFDQYTRRKASIVPHRSTLTTVKNNTNLSSTARQRRSSNVVVATKRVA
ncbi:unnamed protein product [Rotaria magnacalcarata]|uniref:Uncharacterized protein n=1 Tax=Rotaria magnacalcarata TaxID=392030 RepID=A0A8S2M6P9_9BILA|nr:unnamed protein product [Rotaria magnacalcarata]